MLTDTQSQGRVPFIRGAEGPGHGCWEGSPGGTHVSPCDWWFLMEQVTAAGLGACPALHLVGGGSGNWATDGLWESATTDRLLLIHGCLAIGACAYVGGRL